MIGIDFILLDCTSFLNEINPFYQTRLQKLYFELISFDKIGCMSNASYHQIELCIQLI